MREYRKTSDGSLTRHILWREVLDNTGKGHFKLGKYCFVNKQIILEYVCLLQMFRNMQPRTYFHENSKSEELIMTNNSNGIKFIKYRVYH